MADVVAEHLDRVFDPVDELLNEDLALRVDVARPIPCHGQPVVFAILRPQHGDPLRAAPGRGLDDEIAGDVVAECPQLIQGPAGAEAFVEQAAAFPNRVHARLVAGRRESGCRWSEETPLRMYASGGLGRYVGGGIGEGHPVY